VQTPAKPGFFGCLLREIFACNRVATAKTVRRAHISRNEPGSNVLEYLGKRGMRWNRASPRIYWAIA
jgi:hypothetical protein